MTHVIVAAGQIQRVCVIGAGTVGASWALYFLASGLDVSIYDSDPAREKYVRDYLARDWPVMRALKESLPPVPPRPAFHAILDPALKGAHYVQESVTDDLAIKRTLFERLDTQLAAEIVIGSSTSSLLMSELQQGLATAHRFVVAHPFNPPHLIPVVEVVGGRFTSAEAVDHACTFLTRIGKVVVRLRKEVRGHLVNRLQAALFQEAVWMVQEGVADVADIDRGMQFGPGVRWAAAGPFLTFHLGAGAGGIRAYLEHLGAAHERMWRDLQQVTRFTPEIIERIVRGVESEAGDASVERVAAERDTALIRLLKTQ
jgi:carnitine 3-dehydrogenase